MWLRCGLNTFGIKQEEIFLTRYFFKDFCHEQSIINMESSKCPQTSGLYFDIGFTQLCKLIRA